MIRRTVLFYDFFKRLGFELDVVMTTSVPEPLGSIGLNDVPKWTSKTVDADNEPCDEASHEENGESVTRERRFLCDICGARFNRRSTLWNHKRIHSESRPFICPTCKNCFKWKNSLKCHRAMHQRRGEHDESKIDGDESGRKRKRVDIVSDTVESSANAKDEVRIDDKSVDDAADLDRQLERSSSGYEEHQVSVVQLPSLEFDLQHPDGIAWQDHYSDVISSVGFAYGPGATDQSFNEEIEQKGGAFYAKVLPWHLW